MCLITEQKKARITTEDMVVWKLLTRSHESLFFNHIWVKAVLEKVDLEVSVDCEFRVARYFDDIVYCHYQSIHFVTSVSRGFHAMTTKKRAKQATSPRRIIVKCLIPAGSKVFEDATGLIVSNQMMLL